MKKIYYVYGILVCALTIAMSFTWGGIMDRYALVHESVSTGALNENYSIMGGKYGIQIPDRWEYNAISLPKGEIDYHAEILSADKIVRGFVQVWHMNVPLMDFLKQTQISPADSSVLKDYSLNPITIDGHKGYVLEYIRTSNEIDYRCIEYFVEDKNGVFLRLSFFVKESNYNQNLKKLFDKISSTIKINN